MPGEIFCIARLLANHHHFRAAGSLAKDRLRATLVKIARLAASRGIAKLLEARLIGNQIRYRRTVRTRVFLSFDHSHTWITGR
jgi:hypothetical protein